MMHDAASSGVSTPEEAPYLPILNIINIDGYITKYDRIPRSDGWYSGRHR